LLPNIKNGPLKRQESSDELGRVLTRRKSGRRLSTEGIQGKEHARASSYQARSPPNKVAPDNVSTFGISDVSSDGTSDESSDESTGRDDSHEYATQTAESSDLKQQTWNPFVHVLPASKKPQYAIFLTSVTEIDSFFHFAIHPASLAVQ
jgi:hypothetical protein